MGKLGILEIGSLVSKNNTSIQAQSFLYQMAFSYRSYLSGIKYAQPMVEESAKR